MSIDIIKPKLIPVNIDPSGATLYSLVYNTSTERIERILLTNTGNFITIDGYIFRIVKGYTGSVKNTSVSLEPNDYITDGIIRNNNVNVNIVIAKYTGGDITNFGVYDPNNGVFTGGNYEVKELREA